MSKYFITTLILCYIVIKETVELCSDGCLNCNGENQCLVCDNTSLYVLSDGHCLIQNLNII